jgi:hypothetical protein
MVGAKVSVAVGTMGDVADAEKLGVADSTSGELMGKEFVDVLPPSPSARAYPL